MIFETGTDQNCFYTFLKDAQLFPDWKEYMRHEIIDPLEGVHSIYDDGDLVYLDGKKVKKGTKDTDSEFLTDNEM